MSAPAAREVPSGIAAMANRPVNNPVKLHRPKKKDQERRRFGEKRPPGSRVPTKQEVVNGRFLPTTPQQAVEASKTRKRLLKKRADQRERRKKTAKSEKGQSSKNVKGKKKVTAKSSSPAPRIGPDMALMPEFFDEERYDTAEVEEGPVRCVCSVVADDGQHMIQCENEGCDVWQHTDCMREFGDAVPEDTEAGHYLCQVCDPWAHRERILRIRAADSVRSGKKEPTDWETTQQS